MFTVTKTLDPEKHQAILTVTFDPKAFEQAKRNVARAYAQRLHIPGFRPGKAPYALVARRVGERTLAEDALRELLYNHFDDILNQAEVEPGAPSQIESLQLDPPTVVLRVPLKPDIVFKEDYKSLRVPYEPPQVTDEEIDQALDSWRRVFVSMETVDRPAQVGDVVIMDLKGELRTPEGESTDLGEQEVSLLVKDDEDPEEWPYPGFSKELAGLKVGDEKTMTYTYPDNAVDESVRGKTVTYHVHVKEIQTPVFPELTDEFVRENTEYENLEAMREALRNEMAERKQREYEQEYLRQVLEALLERTELRYPPEMIDRVVQELEQRFAVEAHAAGASEEVLRELLQSQRDSTRKQAEEELRKRLVLDQIAQDLGLEPDERDRELILKLTTQDLLTLADHDVQKARRLQREHPDLAADLFELHYGMYRRAMAARYLTNIARGKSHEEALTAALGKATAEGQAEETSATDEAPSTPEAGSTTEAATEASASGAAGPDTVATATPEPTEAAPAAERDSAPTEAETPSEDATPPEPQAPSTADADSSLTHDDAKSTEA
ncbi:MAG: trigger factor [Chloroflexi bacterium]|nr:trigger factor [Chloroflexota bacterium]